MEKILKNFYTNPKNPGGFAGIKKLQKLTGATDKEIKNFVENNKIPQQFKPTRKKFQRARFNYRGLDFIWAIDTVYLKQLATYNDNYQFLLIVSDTFSKFLMVELLESLKGKVVADAFERIMRRYNRKPKMLFSDRGKEMYNKDFLEMLSAHGIGIYSTDSETKSFMAERYVKVIMNKMWPMLAYNNTWAYKKHLQDIVDSINASINRTIGMRPKDVNKQNETCLLHKLNKNVKKQDPKPKFSEGDRVRISINKHQFQKSYYQTYSNEIYIVDKILKRPPTWLYFLKTTDQQHISGGFYAQQLVKTNSKKSG